VPLLVQYQQRSAPLLVDYVDAAKILSGRVLDTDPKAMRVLWLPRQDPVRNPDHRSFFFGVVLGVRPQLGPRHGDTEQRA
jgi:hypothetical protein